MCIRDSHHSTRDLVAHTRLAAVVVDRSRGRRASGSGVVSVMSASHGTASAVAVVADAFGVGFGGSGRGASTGDWVGGEDSDTRAGCLWVPRRRDMRLGLRAVVVVVARVRAILFNSEAVVWFLRRELGCCVAVRVYWFCGRLRIEESKTPFLPYM